MYAESNFQQNCYFFEKLIFGNNIPRGNIITAIGVLERMSLGDRVLMHVKACMRGSISLVAIPLIALWAGLSFPNSTTAQEEELSTYENLSLFSEVLTHIREYYVEEVNETELMQAAVWGMLSSLDPHSSYLTRKQYEEMGEQTTGEFGGLGIEITLENGLVKIISPIDDTPAAKADLQAGDIIIGVDGESFLGLTLEEAVKKLRGKPGSKIILTIDRKDEKSSFDVEIIRAVIKISSASVRQEGQAVVARIKLFNQQTMPNVVEEFNHIVEEAGGLDKFDGLVIDLRNNPGGLLDTAIEISDLFLDDGEIVSVRFRNEKAESFNANKGDITNGMPIVILINGGSASASEIVAGALQDHSRAVIVGTKSFGKGSIQTNYVLDKKYGGLLLTSGRYYTPSGRTIQGNGIIPDIIIQHTEKEEVEEETATVLQYSESDLPNSLENESQEDAEKEAKDREMLESERVKIFENDQQLAHALDILRSIAVLNLLN